MSRQRQEPAKSRSKYPDNLKILGDAAAWPWTSARKSVSVHGIPGLEAAGSATHLVPIGGQERFHWAPGIQD